MLQRRVCERVAAEVCLRHLLMTNDASAVPQRQQAKAVLHLQGQDTSLSLSLSLSAPRRPTCVQASGVPVQRCQGKGALRQGGGPPLVSAPIPKLSNTAVSAAPESVQSTDASTPKLGHARALIDLAQKGISRRQILQAGSAATAVAVCPCCPTGPAMAADWDYGEPLYQIVVKACASDSFEAMPPVFCCRACICASITLSCKPPPMCSWLLLVCYAESAGFTAGYTGWLRRWSGICAAGGQQSPVDLPLGLYTESDDAPKG